MMLLEVVAVLLSLSFVICNEIALDSSNKDNNYQVENIKGAFIVTLAGPNKLAPYFEWSCRTFGYSTSYFDMLVFHEDNKALSDIKCPLNVKFINLGDKGLSKLIVNEILNNKTSEDSKTELLKITNEIIKRCPRYLVETKPMFGTLFQQFLTNYTHWSYTDPDIIWSNLTDWIQLSDMKQFHYISYAKNMDSGRLFLRGQLTLHQNIRQVNNLWRKLEYFKSDIYIRRMSNAFHMIKERKSSDEIFYTNFYSAEGWYSQLVFKAKFASVKIIGRGFDDFFREPVVLNMGKLSRCALDKTISECIDNSINSPQNKTVNSLPPIKLVPAQAHYDVEACKMFWLPVEVRYCIATAIYSKEAALLQDKQTGLKLVRVGEAILTTNKTWFINDERESRRQLHGSAALFHFRHWDDFISSSMAVEWGEGWDLSDNLASCMVLYLRADRALAFEHCESVRVKEQRAIISGISNLILEKSFDILSLSQGKGGEALLEDVGKILQHARKAGDVGAASHSDNPEQPKHNVMKSLEERKAEKIKMLQRKKKRSFLRRGGRRSAD